MTTLTRLVMLLLVALMGPAACRGDCRVYVNGHCYDNGTADLPPLTAKVQLMDAETAKGIPDAWVSLRWYVRTERPHPARCVRSVLGRTDQQGWFSSTAKDGSWFFGDVHYLAPGYEGLRFHNPRGERFEAYVELPTVYDPELIKPWLRSLERLGYAYVDDGGSTKKYSKWLNKMPNFSRYLKPMFEPEGGLKLLVSRRGLPEDVGRTGVVGIACADAGSEKVGYDGERGYALALKIMWTESYQVMCDPRWYEFETVSVPEHMRSRFEIALLLHPDSDKHELLRTLTPAYALYLDRSEENNPLRPIDLSRTERTTLCAAIKPYALPLPFPPAALEAQP